MISWSWGEIPTEVQVSQSVWSGPWPAMACSRVWHWPESPRPWAGASAEPWGGHRLGSARACPTGTTPVGVPSVLTAPPPQLLSDWTPHFHPVGRGHFFSRDTIEGAVKLLDRVRPSMIPTLRQGSTRFCWWTSSRTTGRCDLCSWAYLATQDPILIESQFKETRLALSLP